MLFKSMAGGRFFATANGDGVSSTKNPRVFFRIAKNGTVIGDIQFEVSKAAYTFYPVALRE